jgi:hypothetical protein
MPIEQCILEMDGKISLLDNRKFMVSLGLIGTYYVIFLAFLTHQLIQTGGFH